MQLDHIGIHIPVLSCFCIYTRAARPEKAKGAPLCRMAAVRRPLPAALRPLPAAPRGADLNYSSRPATAAPSFSSASRRTARGHAAFIR